MAVTKLDVINAINGLLAKEFSNATVYKNREPVEFIRPAFLIMAPLEKTKAAAKNLMSSTLYLTITCFAPVDDYGNSDADELAEMQNEAIALFRQGYIKVGNRAIKVSTSSGGQDMDRAWVDVTCDYHTPIEEPQSLPMMQEIFTNYQ